VVHATYAQEKALGGFVPEPMLCPNDQQNDGSWNVAKYVPLEHWGGKSSKPACKPHQLQDFSGQNYLGPV